MRKATVRLVAADTEYPADSILSNVSAWPCVGRAFKTNRNMIARKKTSA